MRVGRSEAIDLLRKWGSEGAVLKVDLSFAAFAACFRGRVFRVSETEVRLLSDDTFSEFVLRIAAGLEFAYAEPREFPGDAEISESALVALLPPSSPGTRDFIAFTELKAPQGR